MSIKRQLTILIISTVVLASFFAALHGYRSSLKQLDKVFDQELVTVADLISKLVHTSSTIPTDIKGDIAFQVLHNGAVLEYSANAPNYPLLNVKEGLGEAVFFGKRWRTYTVSLEAHKVIVAHPIAARIESAESILFVTITPIVIAIPIIAFLIYYIIQKSLASLIILSNQIKQKSTDDLTKIELNNPPEELEPVITRMNNLFIRLDNAFEREKQLTANAAHELRTPISVLTVTAHNIHRDFENKLLSTNSFIELKQNVGRMAHVIEQMIALYRFTPEQFKGSKSATDLQPVLQDVISNNFDDIVLNQQVISLDAQGQDSQIMGNYFALYTLFENVIRNAIKYSGKTAEILVTVISNNDSTLVSIEDSGKGIKDTEYDKIFQRFYRAKENTTRVKGSGLGLSIVHHITTLHEGEILCEKSIRLGGLKITIIFPTYIKENLGA